MEKLILQPSEANDMIVAFGMSEERVRELGKECEVIFNRRKKEGEPPIKMTDKLSEIVELCENMNEAVWAIFNFGYNVGHRQGTKILHVGGKEALGQILKSVGGKAIEIPPFEKGAKNSGLSSDNTGLK